MRKVTTPLLVVELDKGRFAGLLRSRMVEFDEGRLVGLCAWVKILSIADGY